MNRGNGIPLDEALHQRLEEYARSRGVGEEIVLEEAVHEYLSAREGGSLYDAFMEDGLLGCLPGTPPDLSTNEAYFEGFGGG